jgi:hypothetical protein
MIIRGWLMKAATVTIMSAAMLIVLGGCSSIGPMPGYIYTHITYPLTWDLDATPVPPDMPRDAKIIEIKEPFSGLGINARLNSNAIGEIARAHGLKILYFADQERFSILGIWTSNKVILYGQ